MLPPSLTLHVLVAWILFVHGVNSLPCHMFPVKMDMAFLDKIFFHPHYMQIANIGYQKK
jgi:hypothetical protein